MCCSATKVPDFSIGTKKAALMWRGNMCQNSGAGLEPATFKVPQLKKSRLDVEPMHRATLLCPDHPRTQEHSKTLRTVNLLRMDRSCCCSPRHIAAAVEVDQREEETDRHREKEQASNQGAMEQQQERPQEVYRECTRSHAAIEAGDIRERRLL